MLVKGLRELLTRALNGITAGMLGKCSYWVVKALNHTRGDGCRQTRGILTILVTSQLLMELLMDTEELVSVRPVLPSGPSSSCALTAALGGQGKHRENTPERSMSEHLRCRASHRCVTALMFSFHFGWFCTGQSLDTLLLSSAGSCSLPSSSQQSTEISTPLHRLLPTFLSALSWMFLNRSLDAISQIKGGLFHEFIF